RREERLQDQSLYTTLVTSPNEWMFEIERYRLLLNTLGIPPDAESLKPVYWIRDEERVWADKYIANTFPNKQFAVLSPGGGFDAKLWSNESFAAVADWLIEKYRMNVVITGSANDKPLAQEIQKLSKQTLYDITGESSLNQFAALVGCASLFVGIDTAGFHFAWTSGIPAVGIFGGGHFGRFTPSVPHARIVHVPMDCYRCYWHCIYDEIKCITAITPEMVRTEIESVMNVQQGAERKQ
ncbi:MAG TPA: glycosyltransferase family 9 protein, partial [Bacteroidota bacterium]|nr:glycosyltransferase family 9 protein [Bacteroidota bacterium]